MYLAAGKITQFAFYKQKSKRDQQYKKSDAAVESPVGVSCLWFKQCGNKLLLLAELCRKSSDYLPLQQSYICTLSLGCMKDVKSSEIQSSSIRQVPSISTASEFCLDHDVLQFKDICIAEKKQKQNLNPSETQKTKTRTDLIDLTGDSCSAQSESTEKLWVICNGFCLTMKEK